jgi:Rps23 Pro-64 3,4-dihydroxylase Tpa1-like proline 4-hydroxylase
VIISAMLTANCVHFDAAVVETSPFRHFTIENFIDEDVASSLLRWFDEEADWNARSIAGLGTLSSVDLHTSELGRRLDFLTGEPFLSHVRRRMAELFATELEGFVDLTANRMTQSQEIGLHNDVSTLPPAFRFTHRLVVYLNHQYSEGYGGALRLANAFSPSPSAPAQKRILPVHRSAFGFEISESSYHAIEPVHQGTRYNLSFTFYPGSGATNIV